MSSIDRSPSGCTVSRSAGVCGLRLGDRVLLVPSRGPGGGPSSDDGGTDTQRGCPSNRAAEGGTVDGWAGPNGYSGAGL